MAQLNDSVIVIDDEDDEEKNDEDLAIRLQIEELTRFSRLEEQESTTELLDVEEITPAPHSSQINCPLELNDDSDELLARRLQENSDFVNSDALLARSLQNEEYGILLRSDPDVNSRSSNDSSSSPPLNNHHYSHSQTLPSSSRPSFRSVNNLISISRPQNDLRSLLEERNRTIMRFMNPFGGMMSNPLDSSFLRLSQSNEDLDTNNYETLLRLDERIGKLGLNKLELDSLPTIKFNKDASFSNSNNINSEYITCSICFDDYKANDQLKILACFHRFHDSCIDKWLKENRNCPLCKKDAINPSR